MVPESSTCCHPCVSLLAALLLLYLCHYLSPQTPQSDPPLCCLMTVSRGDRQIYLYRWLCVFGGWVRGRSQPPGSGRRGLEETLALWPLPARGHIPVCCPRPGSELSATWDQSLTAPKTHTLPHQPLGEREQSRAERELRLQLLHTHTLTTTRREDSVRVCVCYVFSSH